jgi:hypothetical protein
MSPVIAEVTWLRWLLEDFDVSVSMLNPLLSNSTWAISIAHDPELTKYIVVDAHFTWSQIQNNVVALQYVPSEFQLIDFFTKAQTHAHHQFYLSKLSVVDPPWVWWGIRYVLDFFIIVFLPGNLYIFSPLLYMYIFRPLIIRWIQIIFITNIIINDIFSVMTYESNWMDTGKLRADGLVYSPQLLSIGLRWEGNGLVIRQKFPKKHLQSQ